jgi:hypothetical protein
MQTATDWNAIARHALIAIIALSNFGLMVKRANSSSFETAMGLLISAAVIAIVFID